MRAGAATPRLFCGSSALLGPEDEDIPADPSGVPMEAVGGGDSPVADAIATVSVGQTNTADNL
jgi:hypothetical protein